MEGNQKCREHSIRRFQRSEKAKTKSTLGLTAERGGSEPRLDSQPRPTRVVCAESEPALGTAPPRASAVKYGQNNAPDTRGHVHSSSRETARGYERRASGWGGGCRVASPLNEAAAKGEVCTPTAYTRVDRLAKVTAGPDLDRAQATRVFQHGEKLQLSG